MECVFPSTPGEEQNKNKTTPALAVQLCFCLFCAVLLPLGDRYIAVIIYKAV